jgi:hypothetical protein
VYPCVITHVDSSLNDLYTDEPHFVKSINIYRTPTYHALSYTTPDISDTRVNVVLALVEGTLIELSHKYQIAI